MLAEPVTQFVHCKEKRCPESGNKRKDNIEIQSGNIQHRKSDEQEHQSARQISDVLRFQPMKFDRFVDSFINRIDA